MSDESAAGRRLAWPYAATALAAAGFAAVYAAGCASVWLYGRGSFCGTPAVAAKFRLITIGVVPVAVAVAAWISAPPATASRGLSRAAALGAAGAWLIAFLVEYWWPAFERTCDCLGIYPTAP